MTAIKKSQPIETQRVEDQRFNTLEKTRTEKSRLRSLKAECEKHTPRDRLLDRQLKVVDYFLTRHEDLERQADAEAAAARDEGLAITLLDGANAARATALASLDRGRAELVRLQGRADAAKAELEQLKAAAGEEVAARGAAFDKSMKGRDDAAQVAAAEALSGAKRTLHELAEGSAHPTHLRLAAMLDQVEEMRSSVADFEEQVEAATSDRAKAQAELAAIACDRATNKALAAYVAAFALVDSTKRKRPPVFFFFSSDRCYAGQRIEAWSYGANVVGELGVSQLCGLAAEPDMGVLDQNPMRLEWRHHPGQRKAEA